MKRCTRTEVVSPNARARAPSDTLKTGQQMAGCSVASGRYRRQHTLWRLIAGALCIYACDAAGEITNVVEHELSSTELYGEAAPAHSGFAFSAVLLADSGWTLAEVKDTIKHAANIYSSACDFRFSVSKIVAVEAAPRYQWLDERLEQELLQKLGLPRPIALFVNQTTTNDYAYSYLSDTVSPSEGTAWVTRKASPSCRGPLFAHELGHIAFNNATHSRELQNLMGYTCRSSNIENFADNTKLTTKQCGMLRGLPNAAGR